MALKLINSNIFFLPGLKDWLHLGSAIDGVKEYVCILNANTSQCYVNVWVGSQVQAIEDDNEFEDVARFFEAKGISDGKRATSWLLAKRDEDLGKKG